MLFFLPKSSEITPYPRIYIVFFDNSPVVFCVAGLVGILKGCSNIMKPEHLETLMIKSLNSVSVSLKLLFYVSQASKILPKHDSMTFCDISGYFWVNSMGARPVWPPYARVHLDAFG